MTTVCPALLPPWYLTTKSTLSPSRSVALPLPSSPHWAPTITMAGIVTSPFQPQHPAAPALTRKPRPHGVRVLLVRQGLLRSEATRSGSPQSWDQPDSSAVAAAGLLSRRKLAQRSAS